MVLSDLGAKLQVYKMDTSLLYKRNLITEICL